MLYRHPSATIWTFSAALSADRRGSRLLTHWMAR